MIVILHQHALQDESTVAPKSGLIASPPSDGRHRVIIVSQLETQMQASKAQQLNLHHVCQ